MICRSQGALHLFAHRRRWRCWMGLLCLLACVGESQGQSTEIPQLRLRPVVVESSETSSTAEKPPAAAPASAGPATNPGTAKPPPKPTPDPPITLFRLLPGVGMGGLPPRPERIADPVYLSADVRDQLGVTLRGAGRLRLYGFLRTDLDFVTSRFNDIQNPFFLLPDDARFRVGPGRVPIKPDDFNYSLYPRLTRAGLEYYGRPVERLFDVVPGGRLEIDFQTLAPGGPESRELLRLRLAYMELLSGEFTVVIGQDWDVISPLLPHVGDNGLQWNAGNTGDRRPMLKLLWDHTLEGNAKLQVQQALVLADAINSVDLEQDGLRDNEARGLPGYSARVGLSLPAWVEKQPVHLGAWGAVAQDTTGVPFAGKTRFPLHIFGLDLRLPLTEQLAIQGEAWFGRNADDFRAGVAQGVNPIRGRGSIRAAAGWR